MTFAAGDRILVTMPRAPSREGEYVEARGSRARVLLDGDTETCVVLRERVKLHAGQTFLKRAASLPPEVIARMAEYTHDDRARPVAVPKPPKPWRSDAYRAFVRGRSECACCGHLAGFDADSSMEAHHHGPHAMGQKAGDEKCIPLLRRCHRHFHDHGMFSGASREQTDAIAERVQAELVTAWCHMTLGCTETHAVIVDALIAHLKESRA